MRKTLIVLGTILLLATSACKLNGPAFWQDPFPALNRNTVWIYRSENIQIYYIAKVDKACIDKNNEIKMVHWGFGSGQSVTVRENDNSLYYFEGIYRATEEKFWLLNDYGLDQNNLFTEEEMEAEPTFYRYDMDDLPEDTPQEVLDYIAELEMEDENIAD